MKKKLSIMALAVLVAAGAGAQTVYDATNIAQKDLNGTARFVGMGGAMSALGGDISTIGTNPAGIGIYRSNDAMLTFGYSITGTESNYGGSTFEMNKSRWNLDNIGFVLSTKMSNIAPLRYVNFGFNYHKAKSFYRNMTMQGMMGGIDGQFVSQVNSMAGQFQNAPNVDFGNSNVFYNDDAGWLGALGWNGFLLDDKGYAVVPGEVDGYFRSNERGGIDEYDFNVAFNVNDRFYFGLTIGAYDVEYSKYSLWDELYLDNKGNSLGEGYSLESFNRISGAGFDMKFGVIMRPFEYSPLRLGLSIHTPTFYRLTYTTGALLNANLKMTNNETGVEYMENVVVNTQDYLDGRDMGRDFHLRTPWVVNASVGYTVGNYLALGAEYEYEDYSTMKFRYPGGEEMAWETGEADLCMKAVHTARVGLEYKPVSAFSLRAGYNYSSAAFRSDAIKALPSNSINTDTDFANNRSMNTFTLGIGYRGSLLYADLAYKYDFYKADFYPFYNDINGPVTPPSTVVTNTRSQVLLTLGVRF